MREHFRFSVLVCLFLFIACDASTTPEADQQPQANQEKSKKTEQDQNEKKENRKQETRKNDHQKKNKKTPTEKAQSKPSPYRTVSIPRRENIYSAFDTTVLQTEKEWNTFVKKRTGDESKKNTSPEPDPRLARFINALKQAEVDFEQEALILLRHTESRGNVKVQFTPRVKGDGQLTIRVEREVQGEFGTEVMQYFCYAIAVNTERISTVRVEQKQEKTRTLKIQQK